MAPKMITRKRFVFKEYSSQTGPYEVAMDTIDPEWIKHLVMNLKKSHREISDIIKARGRARGFSERSVRRFCEKHNIHYRSGLSNEDLAAVTRNAVNQVFYCTFNKYKKYFEILYFYNS